jgi:hypothetical protein
VEYLALGPLLTAPTPHSHSRCRNLGSVLLSYTLPWGTVVTAGSDGTIQVDRVRGPGHQDDEHARVIRVRSVTLQAVTDPDGRDPVPLGTVTVTSDVIPWTWLLALDPGQIDMLPLVAARTSLTTWSWQSSGTVTRFLSDGSIQVGGPLLPEHPQKK